MAEHGTSLASWEGIKLAVMIGDVMSHVASCDLVLFVFHLCDDGFILG